MTGQARPADAHATIVRQKPLMNMRQILLMNSRASSASSTASGCSRPR